MNTKSFNTYFIYLIIHTWLAIDNLFIQGHIAKRFGDLVRDIWSGELKTIAPIKLR